MLDWIWKNKEWVFSGIGVAAVVAVVGWIRSRQSGQVQRSSRNSTNLQAGRDIKIGGGKRGRH
jgi:hypothetical protein